MRGRSINAFCFLLVWYQITFKVINNDISASCSSLFKNTIPHGKCFGVLYGILCIYFSFVSLAGVSSEAFNLQRVFLRICDTKGGSLCQAFLAETVETGNKNHCVIEATHVLRRKLRKD